MAPRLLCFVSMQPNVILLISAFALPFCLSACVADVEPEPVYAEATYVPPDIETYPSVVYEGHPSYFVEGHWYYRNGPQWVYYRNEPAELHRQRAVVQRAPRAAPRVEYRGDVRRPDYAAPPAREVR